MKSLSEYVNEAKSSSSNYSTKENDYALIRKFLPDYVSKINLAYVGKTSIYGKKITYGNYNYLAKDRNDYLKFYNGAFDLYVYLGKHMKKEQKSRKDYKAPYYMDDDSKEAKDKWMKEYIDIYDSTSYGKMWLKYMEAAKKDGDTEEYEAMKARYEIEKNNPTHICMLSPLGSDVLYDIDPKSISSNK